MAAAPPSALLLPRVASFPLHLLLLLLLLAAPSTVAQASVGNITLGSTLDDETSVRASPSGDFAFGFYPLRPNNDTFLLGIWFDKIPEKTLVWYADKPVRRGSKVQLREDGQLVLNDHTGEEVWTASSGGVQVAYAAMLDSGNFVLSSSTSVFGWQSFDHPVDTILPGQEMERGGKLSSRRTQTDYSVGRFQLRLLYDGNLVLNTINLETQFAYEAYWWSNTLNLGRQVVYNRTGEIYVVNTDGGVKNAMSVTLGSPEDFYQRATLDHDGVFRLYVYPKDASGARNWPTGTWSVAEYFPRNFCLDVLVKKAGSGPCGFNSYCQLDKGFPICECPPGYSLVDPADINKGCKADYVGQGCNPDGSHVEGEDMFILQQMTDIDWPESDYEQLSPVDETACRKSCLKDCLCAVAIHGGEDCWKKKMPLSNGRLDSASGRKALIKLARDNSSSRVPPIPPPLRPSDSEQPSRGRSASRRVLLIFLGVSVLVNVLLLSVALITCPCSTKKKFLPWQRIPSKASFPGAHLNLRFFTYRELERATGRFNHELGKGSFGIVYKGTLEFDGSMSPVAVKKLQGITQEGEQEFRTELKAIGQTHHRNLVRLLGFCDEGSHRLLVYEFVSVGIISHRILCGAASLYNIGPLSP